MPGLLVGSAPRAHHVEALRRAGVTRIVDLRSTTAPDVWLADLHPWNVPVPDFGAPDLDTLEAVTDQVLRWLGAEETVLIHCRQGLGRSVTVTCAVLVRLGYDVPSAWRHVVDRRRGAAPSDVQVACLEAFAARLAGRATDYQA